MTTPNNEQQLPADLGGASAVDNSNKSATSSSSSAKKELFPQINAINAVGLAVNLFDKLRKQNSTNSPPNPPVIASSLSALSSSSSASEIAASASPTSNNLFTNLALSFGKSRSSLQAAKESPKSKAPESLTIVDDDPVDDVRHPETEVTGAINRPSKSPIPVSQSDISLSTKSNFDFEPSSSSPSDHDAENLPPAATSLSASQSFASKLSNPAQVDASSSSSSLTTSNEGNIKSSHSSSSSTLMKLGSAFLKGELANSALDEADTLRRRLLTKKKSIELSLESIRNKVSSTSTSPIAISPNSNSSTPLNSHSPSSSSSASTSASMSTNINQPENNTDSTKRVVVDVSANSTPQGSYVSSSVLESISDAKTCSPGGSNSECRQNETQEDKPSSTELITDEQPPNEMIERPTSLTQAIAPAAADDAQPPSPPTPNDQKRPTTHSLLQEILSPKAIVAVIAVLVGIYLVTPSGVFVTMLTYLTGFLCGSLVTLLLIYLAIKFDLLKYLPAFNKLDIVRKDENDADKSQENEKITSLRNLLIETAFLKENTSFDGVFKGWMNELREYYDPENYFLNKTRSVFLNLDGTMLRLQTTSSKVPKRAMWNEQIASCTFSELRIYDLSDCEVFILPKELVRKRYWSKKYPLCLKGVKLTSNSSKTPSSGTGGLSSSPSSSQLSQRFSQSSANLPSSASSQNLVGQPLDKNTLILFARTDREKEEWFKLFKKSAAKTLIDSNQYLKQQKAKLSAKLASSSSNNAIAQPVKTSNGQAKPLDSSNMVFSYSATSDKIIYKILDDQKPTTSQSQSSSSAEPASEKPQNGTAGDPANTSSLTNTIETQTDNGLLYDRSLSFLNTFLIRTFADFFNEPKWINLIQTKIQKKLSTIKVPHFMEELRITGMDLGCVIPLIKQASEPWYDEKGLWVHLDIDYSGGLQMSLATKLNLMKLKSNASATSSAAPSTSSSPGVAQTATFTFKNIDSGDEPILLSSLASSSQSSSKRALNDNPEVAASEAATANGANGENPAVKKRKPHSAITHSDEEDSPESSGDEYVHTGFNNDDDNKLIETANASKKLLSLVNKIAASNYFQKATENKYIKMAMENVSNCQLLLTVEVRKISGTLALNIPPHPSDRLWYGFVTNPTMVLVATPQVGDKEVSYSAITDWIAVKLKQEFQKILVFPNMDDIYIPLLNSEINNQNW